MCLCPVIFGCVISIVVAQTESEDLLLYLFQCEFVILPHSDILLDLLILLRRDMYRAVITMSQTPCNQSGITLIRFHSFLTSWFWHCRRGKNHTFHVMTCKLVV